MPDYVPRNTRPESYSYVGRGSHGVLPGALCMVIVGLVIGLVASPTGHTHAELTPPDQLVMHDFRPPDEGLAYADRASAEQESGDGTHEAGAHEAGAHEAGAHENGRSEENDAVVHTPPALDEQPPLLLASINPDDPRHADSGENKQRSLKVRSGDTLMSLMLSAGVDRIDAHEAVAALRAVYNPRDLRAGQQVRLTISPEDSLTEIALDPSVVRRVAVRRDDDATFKAFEVEKTLTREMSIAGAEITSSLYVAAVRAGVPVAIIAELMRIYSWDVDFQREIQSGDRFEVAYEQFLDEEGDLVRVGEVIYATLTLSGQKKPLYRFDSGKGPVNYFNDKGQSARRPLLRTPIDGARLSSGFGARRHPILGYNRMHRGVDFAAPTGTPIYAAGDGVITYRGRKGAYGNYIQIRHASNYQTAYAHMHGFKSGVNQGSRVRQGDVIGYVGTTGRSTGPHLHYEILLSGTQVNPLTVKMPSGTTLSTRDMARFEATRADIDTLVAGLRREIAVSTAENLPEKQD
ncbi:MAG: peptidoglycan DD-metalloendopeptidase family protein [Rhodospirillaceae bacterium]